LLFLLTGLALFAGCQQPRYKESLPGAPASPPPKVKYSESYDAEIEAVLALARDNNWTEAQKQSADLLTKEPGSAALQRLNTWVVQQGQKYREQSLENKIREVEAKNSVFNPTIPSLLTEEKDRGLPATKDVRDTINRIENTPYIPETYGKVIMEKGPLFDIDSAKGPMAKVLEKEVSLHLDNVALEAIIVNISQTAGVNIVADKSLPALKQQLSINLDKVRLGELLKYIGRNYELQFQVGPELVWVVDAKDPKRLMEETRFYRLKKGFLLPAQLDSEEAVRTAVVANNVRTETETQKFKKFVNDAAPAQPSIEKAITNLFTGSKVYIDYERNLVVGRGTPEQLEVLENIIKEFDKPIQQVLIEARFVTLSKPAFLQLGVLWETGRITTGGRTPTDFTGLVPSTQIPNLGVGIQHAFTNVFGAETLSATITALEQSGESQTLSAPRLTVLNNRPASIQDGKVQYYYEEYQVKQTVQQYYTSSSLVPSGKPTKITAGSELNVMASISGDGQHIILALNPRVNTDVQLVKFATLTDSQPGGLTSSFDINLPQYRTQELATRVVVKSGQTVVMGGVLEREKSTLVESVPVLGNLPLLGMFFRRRTEVDRPRYLLVFVTATIVTDSGEYLIYDDERAAKK
jgi:type IV pilus assembly protein PilQ